MMLAQDRAWVRCVAKDSMTTATDYYAAAVEKCLITPPYPVLSDLLGSEPTVKCYVTLPGTKQTWQTVQTAGGESLAVPMDDATGLYARALARSEELGMKLAAYIRRSTLSALKDDAMVPFIDRPEYQPIIHNGGHRIFIARARVPWFQSKGFEVTWTTDPKPELGSPL